MHYTLLGIYSILHRFCEGVKIADEPKKRVCLVVVFYLCWRPVLNKKPISIKLNVVFCFRTNQKKVTPVDRGVPNFLLPTIANSRDACMFLAYAELFS